MNYKILIDKLFGQNSLKLIFLIGLTVILLNNSIEIHAQTRYHIEDGKIEFKSDAPNELIEANTSKFLGILDIDQKAFAISIPVATFKGFNSALQREHFNENYMETSKYPKGIYKGVIINKEVDLTKNGYYDITTKGKLLMHGVELDKEINCKIRVEGDLINVKTEFEILLKDYNIKIPTVVRYKIAEKINIIINADFVLRR